MEPHTPNRLWNDKRYAVVERDGAKCRWCSHFETKNLTIDHIIPYSKGGIDIVENMQLLCRHCHQKKNKIERESNCHGSQCKNIGCPLHFMLALNFMKPPPKWVRFIVKIQRLFSRPIIK